MTHPTPTDAETGTVPAPEDVRAAVAGVPDPELPPVTLGMLGMVHDITIDGSRVTVELLPTFSGCPATDMMGRDVESAVGALPGVTEVVVRFRFSPPWSASRITDEGHEALRSFGIAPPRGASHPGPDAPPGARRLPVLTAEDRATRDVAPCPYCDSEDTTRESAFGPTPCRDIRFCNACGQPFEAFKDL